uniref:Uncharacterized protein n=1 Tax=uncultured prokaryote TaxID=198431 RepID=A0A0H5Q2B0_9ZZZZ|nr:hypothetical protein [uncultured prokaryote]
MAYESFLQVSLFGGYTTAIPGDEIWQFGFKTNQNVSDADELQALADAWGPLMGAAFSDCAQIASAAEFRGVKCAPIGPDGHYTGEPGIYDAPAPPVGGSAFSMLPLQNAVVVSTIANGVFRGAGRYGRFYVPGVTTNALTGGVRIKSDARDDYIDFAIALFEITRTGTDTPHNVRHFPISGGNAIVNEVRCGDVVDTQRRRRNQLVETYSSQSYGT